MPIPRRIEIARFPGNKRFAITTSWDDGVADDRLLVACLNKLGLKGTFNVCSGKFRHDGVIQNEGYLNASEVASLYTGHEVAIHTCTHPHLALLDPSAVALEVLEDRKRLEDLVGYPVRGMAYPYGSYSPKVIEILRALGIVYCRTGERLDPCFPPKEPLAWPTTTHMFSRGDPDDIGTRFGKMIENRQASGVYFIWGHSFEFSRTDSRESEIMTLFKPLAGHDFVWYCTNIELFDYEAARQRMVIAANKRTAYNPSALAVTLIVDGKTIEAPPGQLIQLT